MGSSALSATDEATVVAAIGAAELGNTGEVRVHLEGRSGTDPMVRARRWFFQLGMHHTADGTGVLLYVAVKSRQVAVFAGPGIYQVAPREIWHEATDAAAKGFTAGTPGAGLCAAIELIGDVLRAVIPGEDKAGNELEDTVSTS